jgi:hypothetical protein
MCKGHHYRFIQGHQNFKSPVEYVVDETTGCWVWQRAKTTGGYGTMTSSGVPSYAHRTFYERHKGAIPEGMSLDHLTHTENVRRGNATKISQETVETVHGLSTTLSKRAIADRCGIKYSAVHDILSGRRRRYKPSIVRVKYLCPGDSHPC